jgi:hypothetical protein
MDNEEEDKPEDGGGMRSSEVLDQVSATILYGHRSKGLSRFAFLQLQSLLNHSGPGPVDR